jgi:hypothetical protein
VGSEGVHIYTRQSGIWTKQARILPLEPSSTSTFGSSLALQDGVLLVAAPARASHPSDDPLAYVFVGAGDQWSLQAELRLAAGAPAGYGSPVALQGEWAFVGAPAAEIDSKPNQGSVYVFRHVGDAWIETNVLTAADGAASDRFGSGIVVDNDTLIVGAAWALTGEDGSRGAAYVFIHQDGSWIPQAKLIAGEWPFDGLRALALEGDTAVLGSTPDDFGRAYVFERTNTTWTRTQLLLGDETMNQNRPIWASSFGSRAVLEGEQLFMGAPDHERGRVYMFERRDAPPVGALRVFLYDDRDGDYEYYAPIDRPLENWVVRLRDTAGAQIGEDMLTDVGGTARFADLPPGAYTACMVLQLHWVNLVPGGDDGPIEGEGHEVCQMELVSVGDEPQLTFANSLLPPFGTIGVKAFSDLNGNGVQDSGEPPLAGASVLVFDDRYFPLFDPMPTDANGELNLVIQPGQYTVCLNETYCRDVTVIAYETASVVFAIRPPPTPGVVRVQVYHDVDSDGVRQPGEPPLAGWAMAIINADGHQQGPDRLTDAGGEVLVEDLDAGPYRICLRLPAYWRNTEPGYVAWPHVCRVVTVAPGQETATQFGNAVAAFYYYLHLPAVQR